jgi:hypothetical protein
VSNIPFRGIRDASFFSPAGFILEEACARLN